MGIHTTAAAVKKTTEESTRERDLSVWAWAGTVAMDRSMCDYLPPPRDPRYVSGNRSLLQPPRGAPKRTDLR